ncbi:hypothetical protein ETB97_006248 [Aspergillus alliaceus]|uniref:Tat pathway signal sequence n=1 Tax=Petromyces alliaceus TaxID=209559 RepID=A0A5N6FJ65_PETAA|nr:uncharacterized protein BDW43DRAFT_314463 [Aspergillus alliaceus]KAB8230026.1 hypothetical protein BDW43DRAFT_314463 [Aspergillus alliaceus]KAE8388801.1 hypothetical protein BDV23DRAFT_185110 [Aspergillus alliaceus]KAF5857104.1 hypothetical protein ETB97_006248 [Aspergillus burnettii]
MKDLSLRALQDVKHAARTVFTRQQYAQVESKNSFTGQRRPPNHSLLARTIPWILHLILLFTAFGFLTWRYQTVATDKICTSRLSPYSPVIDAGVIRYKSHDVAGDFAQDSIYRGRPTNRTEAAWESIFASPGINIPHDKLPLLGKSPDVTWMRTPKDKGDGYVGFLEVFHQLHCLNMVRLSIHQKEYEEEFGYPPDQFDPEHAAVTATHVDHCLETLRLNLMCTGDVTPLMIEVDDTTYNGRRADFKIMHKCRNFWDIKAWVEMNKVVD